MQETSPLHTSSHYISKNEGIATSAAATLFDTLRDKFCFASLLNAGTSIVTTNGAEETPDAEKLRYTTFAAALIATT